jgi:hypothetical protein
MKIKLHEVQVSDLFNGYKDNDEEGVVGYGGELDIRPKYQREYVYGDAEQQAVIHTILHDFPLNVIYWVRNEQGTFEVLDGQQRILSICKFLDNMFSIQLEGRHMMFHNLQESMSDLAQKILDYKLMVFVVEDGTDSERLDWFKIINIAGVKLSDQELRNAIYTGSWLSDAKLKFSKTNCVAQRLANSYVNGSPIRQEYLETAIKWILPSNDFTTIEEYMSAHQHDPNANALWLYFASVIDWTGITFNNYRKEMKGINWGELYDEFKDETLDSKKLEMKVAELMSDYDVTNKKGIYNYVLTGNETKLSIRAFNDRDKRAAYERQKGHCASCKKKFTIDKMQADHIKPWSKGGKTVPDNCQMLCEDCNRRKGGR